MRTQRHGVARRCILLLLAAAMPLCCCAMNTFAATSSGQEVVMSCCGAAAACQTNDAPAVPSESDGCGSCCCVKALATIDHWSPPTDDIGMPLPLIERCVECEPLTSTVQLVQTNVPPPGPWSASAPALRHACILQI